MALTISAFNHDQWRLLCLQHYADFADHITKCNIGEDTTGDSGDWYYIPDIRLPNNCAVIYHGSWGNDNPLGASFNTHAQVFDMDDPDDAAEYTLRVQHWQSQPECDEQPA